MEVREEQQRIVLDLLAAAAGDPVSYARLREAGVEFPASVIAELELAGLAVRRGPRIASHSRDPAVSLCAAGRAEVAEPSSATAVILDPPARRSHRRRALLAAAGSIAGVVIVLAAIGLLSPRGHGSPARATLPPRAAAQRTKKPRPAAQRRGAAGPQRASVAPPAKRHQARGTPPAPVLPASAATLQLSGHNLLANGRYAQAAAVLRQAMRATGMDVANCATPAGEGCLVYAYALYDLGRSLLLEGRPAEAVAALTARLRIANQQPVVAAELARARAAEVRK
jgi:hypothetical protein